MMNLKIICSDSFIIYKMHFLMTWLLLRFSRTFIWTYFTANSWVSNRKPIDKLTSNYDTIVDFCLRSLYRRINFTD